MTNRKLKRKTRLVRTAEHEIGNLIGLAFETNGDAGAKRDMMLRRYGVGRDQESFKQIGVSIGVTGERVRQIETKMFERLRALPQSKNIPTLIGIDDHVNERDGSPWSKIEVETQPLLGSVPLEEALRFARIIRGKKPELAFKHGRVFGNSYLRILTSDPYSTKLASQVSVAARKFVSFAAAAMVQDVRSYVERKLKTDISTKTVIDVLDSLPELVWLDTGKRWFTFFDVDLNRTLKRVAAIITLACAPVAFDTLFLGLVRESKRPATGKAVGFIDPLPPPHVVLKLLELHPAFVRRSASSFSLRESFDAMGLMDGFHLALIEAMDRYGGIATIDDLRQVRRKDGTKIKKDYLGATLYLGYFLDRHGQSLYSIRGRHISETAIAAAKKRQAHQSKK